MLLSSLKKFNRNLYNGPGICYLKIKTVKPEQEKICLQSQDVSSYQLEYLWLSRVLKKLNFLKDMNRRTGLQTAQFNLTVWHYHELMEPIKTCTELSLLWDFLQGFLV
jgi:hypothetical protein